MKVLENPGREFLIELERLMKKYDLSTVDNKGKRYTKQAEFVASTTAEGRVGDEGDLMVVVDLPMVDGRWQSVVIPYRPYDEEAWDEGE
jgi:hypothetical protein